MMLERMIRRQQAFSGLFWEGEPSREQKVAWTKENLLAAIVEAGEVLDELAWKLHRPGSKVVIAGNLREELVDMFKFWLNVWVLWGFTENDLVAEFERKSDVVEARYRQEKALDETQRPIAIVDIDGVLADYPASFHQFVARHADSGLAEISHRDWVRLKHEYRESGVKEIISCRPGAQEMMEALRERRFVVVLSQRPYFRYKRIFGDTLGWLARNLIPVDAVVFTEDKQWFAYQLQERGKRVEIAVEDDVDNANKLARLGAKVYVVNQSYNREGIEADVVRVDGLDEIAAIEGSVTA